MMLSVMMSFSIDQGLAPMAFLTPNSRVRSFTVMSMMLLTPMYKDNKALKDEHLPEGKENPLPSRVAMMTDDVLTLHRGIARVSELIQVAREVCTGSV